MEALDPLPNEIEGVVYESYVVDDFPGLPLIFAVLCLGIDVNHAEHKFLWPCALGMLCEKSPLRREGCPQRD